MAQEKDAKDRMASLDFRKNTPAIVIKDTAAGNTSILYSISLKSHEQTVEELADLLHQLLETSDEVCVLGNRVFLPNGQVLTDVHPESFCAGMGCSIHHPSKHHMGGMSQIYLFDRMLMMRECEHGVNHPDPDDKSMHLVYLRDDFDLSHGCCRYQCCENRSRKTKESK